MLPSRFDPFDGRTTTALPSRRLRGTSGWLEYALSAGRILAEQLHRSSRTYHQLSTAVRATSLECACALSTEGAFERTNQRIARMRRQIAITALTIRAQLQHGYDSSGASSIVMDTTVCAALAPGVNRELDHKLACA
jgi:hypothetical protein